MTKTEILSYIDAQPAIVLTTMNGTQPESRAMINIRNANIAPHLVPYFQNSGRILFITNTHSDKMAQIRANGAADIYMCDDKFAGLLLTGKIIEITDRKTIEDLWDDSWKMYYPNGRDGGDFSVLEFVPEQYKSYDGSKGEFAKQQGRVE